MNPSLLLGVGNPFKSILSSMESLYPNTTFAILDAWAKVQEVKVVEEETETVDDTTVKFVRDLSYFIQPPTVDIRFDATQYEDGEMHRMIAYIPHQRALLQEQLAQRLDVVAKRLHGYSSILVTCNACDPLALDWVLPLVKKVQDTAAITVFSCYPAAFEGGMLTALANHFSEGLMDTAAMHYAFFRQELADRHRGDVLKVFWEASKRIQAQTIKALLGGGPVPSEFISLL